MPRAFLVVKKKPQQQLQQQHQQQQQGEVMDLPPTTQSESLKRPRALDDSVDTAAARYMAPLSGVMEQPRPSSASPAASYISSEEPYSPASSSGPHEDCCSPQTDPPTLPCPTAGLPFSGLPSVYEFSHKRQRLSQEVAGQEQPCTISPGSMASDTGSDASVVPSPCKPADQHPHRYMMFNPRHMASQVSPSDQVQQPLSPLHHLVRQHPFAFPPGFPTAAYPVPFMRAPMFLPQHFKQYPQPLPAVVASSQKVSVQPEKITTTKQDNKPSPRPRISHNIDDLLARSPPKKTQKPMDTTVEQPKPVLVQDVRPKESLRQSPKSPHRAPPTMASDSPMHQLVAMERMYAQSPRGHQHHLTHSPKNGSVPPVSNSPSSPRSKPRAPRSLEDDFQKQYLESILPEALRQRQQRLADEYRELLALQSSRLTMEQQKAVQVKDEYSSDRKAADINRNKAYRQMEGALGKDYGRETVFPYRQGENDKEMLHPGLAERLSPSALDNLPVDFSKACPKRPGPPRFQCDGCKKSYSTLNGLSKHKEFHCVSHVKKEFSCKQCSKTYTSLGALKMHIRTHTLPCKCQLCGKSFSRPWLLQGHIRTHTGEKPFSCQHCQRSFADRSNLRAHLQTHTDIKRYSCDTCTKTFSRMSLLTKHRENGCAQINMIHH